VIEFNVPDELVCFALGQYLHPVARYGSGLTENRRVNKKKNRIQTKKDSRGTGLQHA
jgi:hypothetical protein